MTPEQWTSLIATLGSAGGPTVMAIILYMLWRGELVTKGHLDDVKAMYQQRIERLKNGNIDKN